MVAAKESAGTAATDYKFIKRYISRCVSWGGEGRGGRATLPFGFTSSTSLALSLEAFFSNEDEPSFAREETNERRKEERRGEVEIRLVDPGERKEGEEAKGWAD